ncbi:MAG: gamma-glutamylcyclotransferase family protein [Anaerolineae bacterium]
MERERLPLFVYGTLRPGGAAFGRIALFVRGIERARLPSHDLYDLGAYPMALPGAGVVVGELLTLHSETYTYALHRLDRYEGYDAAQDDGLYLRRRVTVTTAEGQAVAAWTYLGTAESIADRPPIPSGDWLARHR